jgi:UDP-glucose 4-epimerase
MILITGSCGYLGSHLVEYLEKNNIDYLGFDNLSNPFYIKPIQNLMIGDINDKELLESLFQSIKIDTIIHLAGLINIRDSVYFPGKFFDMNCTGTNNIVNLAVKYKIDRLILASSTTLYKETYEKADENFKKAPKHTYGITHLMNELMLNRYAYASGLNYTILRFSNIGGGVVARRDLISKCFRQDSIYVNGLDNMTEDGSPVRDYIDVRDATDVIIKVLENPDKTAYEAFNVCSGVSASVLEVVKEVAGYKTLSFEKSLQRSFETPYQSFSNDKISKLLNWQPKYSLKDIIEYANNFYQEYCSLKQENKTD